MSATARHPGIRKVTTKAGEIRYRLIVDMGKRPDGSRDQRCETFTRLGDAKARQAKIMADRQAGTLVKPTKVTLAEAVDSWLAGRRNLRPATLRSYRDSLVLATARVGHLQVQNLTKAHLDAVVTELLASGRRVGNVQRSGLSPRSVNLMLTLLGTVLETAIEDGLVARNVARMVERPKQDHKEMDTWTADQAGRFLGAVAEDRLLAAWMITANGLRRGEVLGLCWSDIDLDARTLTIRLARTVVAGEVMEGEPKTERGKRTLPLDTGLVTALRSLKARQAQERLAAGEAYSGGCGDCGGTHVVVDELGQPPRPEWYSDRFVRITKAAGLPAIRLHDARHTCGTLMHLRGVPVAVISKWLGHASAAFTMSVYVHSQDDALAAASETLAAAFGRSEGAL